MPIQWPRPGATRKGGDPLPGATEAPREHLVCKGLYKVLERVFQAPKPEILDLGPLCGETVAYLGGKGARVHVGSFTPPKPSPPRKAGQPAPLPEPLDLPYRDESLDLVLGWDQIDFVPPERLQAFGDELHRILRPGGHLFLFSQGNRAGQGSRSSGGEVFDHPARFRILDPSHVRFEKLLDQPRRRRWIHPNREIERGIGKLSVQGIHLLRNQLREFTAIRI